MTQLILVLAFLCIAMLGLLVMALVLAARESKKIAGYRAAASGDRVTRDWVWSELALLDLDIMADGKNEDALLRDLEDRLVSEYHLALKFGQTPFVGLLRTAPDKTRDQFAARIVSLRLPPEVRLALADVFRVPGLPTRVSLRAEQAPSGCRVDIMLLP